MGVDGFALGHFYQTASPAACTDQRLGRISDAAVTTVCNTAVVQQLYSWRRRPASVQLSVQFEQDAVCYTTACAVRWQPTCGARGGDHWPWQRRCVGLLRFLPTQHNFIVNGLRYSVEYMEPLDMWGCTDSVLEGVEPNGYGAWWFGRNGWCNGHAIRPWVVDVTTAVLPLDRFEVTYFARMYDSATGGWRTPNSTGYILLSSHLAVYGGSTPTEERI